MNSDELLFHLAVWPSLILITIVVIVLVPNPFRRKDDD